MSKYLPKEKAVTASRIAVLGATPGYVQLDNGKIVNLNDLPVAVPPQWVTTIGDWLVKTDATLMLLTSDQFDQLFGKPDLKTSLESIEELIESVDMQTSGPLTLCILTLSGNRKIHGHCTQYIDDMCTAEEAQGIAYSNALAQLMHLESHHIQGQLSKVTA